jgi:dipeptidyl aminopeptidase/acylaminoacyl peptidase
MGGLSFGSDVVLWVAMKSNLLAAASVTSPSVSPNYVLLHSLEGAAFRAGVKASWGLGAPDQTPDRWKLVSPAFNVAAIHAPVLFQMPEQEYVQALDYVLPLAASPTPADLYVFPNEPHNKVQPRHKLAAYTRNLDWYRFWLQGYVDPDPVKAAQYDHWRALQSRAQQAGQHPGHGDTATLPTSDRDVRVRP